MRYADVKIEGHNGSMDDLSLATHVHFIDSCTPSIFTRFCFRMHNISYLLLITYFW